MRFNAVKYSATNMRSSLTRAVCSAVREKKREKKWMQIDFQRRRLGTTYIFCNPVARFQPRGNFIERKGVGETS